MPRPCKMRRVSCNPQVLSFVPGDMADDDGIERVSLTRDELEAIRLADYEGLYQEQAAKKMEISRQTFGNIIAVAHKKVADFLINSKSLSVEGGNIEIDQCRFLCFDCNHTWFIPRGRERPKACPRCESIKVCCSKKKNSPNAQPCWRNQ